MKKTQFLKFFKRMSGIRLPGRLVLEQVTTWETADARKQPLITECRAPEASLAPPAFAWVLEGGLGSLLREGRWVGGRARAAAQVGLTALHPFFHALSF